MSSLPPPTPEPSLPQPIDAPLRRWRGTDRWKRWTAYGAVVFVGLGVIGATTGSSPEESTLRTADDATASTAPTAQGPDPTTASTSPPTEPSEPSAPTTADRSTIPPRTTGPPPTTAPVTAPPATTISVTVAALDLLAAIPIAREQSDGYNRELFGYGAPVDEFGCRTRALVLIRDSLTPAQIDRSGCAVVAGDWFSTYDGLTWSDVGEVQIDHVVALKEAWDSGANSWTVAQLEAFANDVAEPRALRVVTGSINETKSDKDPVNWLPPDDSAVCQYLADWVSIKARWGLSMDESEHGRVRNLLTDDCPGQTVAPWVAVPPALASTSVAPAPPITSTSPVAPPGGGSCDPAYPDVCIPPAPPDLDCGDISFRKFRVLPPDPHNFDGNDNDGLGCES